MASMSKQVANSCFNLKSWLCWSQSKHFIGVQVKHQYTIRLASNLIVRTPSNFYNVIVSFKLVVGALLFASCFLRHALWSRNNFRIHFLALIIYANHQLNSWVIMILRSCFENQFQTLSLLWAQRSCVLNAIRQFDLLFGFQLGNSLRH